MNNFDRLECFKFMAEGKFYADEETVVELLEGMDNITPMLYEEISYCLRYFRDRVKETKFLDLCCGVIYDSLSPILERGVCI